MDLKAIVDQYDSLFGQVLTPEGVFKYETGYLADTLIEMMPTHVNLTIENFNDVDALLALYPYLYQKIVILHAHMVHKVREYSRKGHQESLGKARDLRDTMEELLKVVKLQYESISRRITLRIETRG